MQVGDAGVSGPGVGQQQAVVPQVLLTSLSKRRSDGACPCRAGGSLWRVGRAGRGGSGGKHSVPYLQNPASFGKR